MIIETDMQQSLFTGDQQKEEKLKQYVLNTASLQSDYWF